MSNASASAAGPRKILVTSALPYANGPLHLGHILESIQTDIWTRFQRLRGHCCHYICADDAHGTAIMLKAEEEGVTAEELIAQMRAEHLRDFGDFHILFDNYHSTHSEENRRCSEWVYERCRKAGYIVERTVRQAYDPEKKLFLADRFIIGECPRCNAAEQYGDSCEACGANYSAAELRNPRSALSGAAPEQRESLHYFFRLPDFADHLASWLNNERLQPQVTAKLSEWLKAGLQEWDISRDAPYFGFEIPDAPGKYFYVWLDAPIGYLASWKNFCERKGMDAEAWWTEDSETELHHFIGKDIINFHGLFWPALLKASGLRMPSAVYAHGFLTVNGEKMSKSRGTFIRARRFLETLDPDCLRYYFAARLGAGVEDIDLNLEDFRRRINADLVGKVVNIASRCARFINRHFDHTLATPDNTALTDRILDAGEEIADRFENREYRRAMRRIIALADETNRFLEEKRPWDLARQDPAAREIQSSCSTGIAAFRLLMLYLKPVLPALTQRAEAFLGEELHWETRGQNTAGRRIAQFQPLLQRITPEQITALQSSAD